MTRPVSTIDEVDSIVKNRTISCATVLTGPKETEPPPVIEVKYDFKNSEDITRVSEIFQTYYLT